jgi:hypothetical protein
MSWFSILPESVSFVEVWAVRIFVYDSNPYNNVLMLTESKLFLGAIAIGPWLLLIVYDAILYIFRAATYEVPYIGGRARNRPRPRAPSLSERPSGRARTFSLAMPTTALDNAEQTLNGIKRRVEGEDGREDTDGVVE